jgi:glycosyltransferase involved in cell wall biosynthesis
MARVEHLYLQKADHVLTVSDTDRDIFAEIVSPEKITTIPTGVDIDYFSGALATAPEESNSLVFTGSMDWLPNEDGIRYFTEQVMPVIKAALPDVTLTVVGRNPYSSLRELAQRDSSIIVTGRVDDVRPHMERAAIYVVPLRVGGGTRLKIYEAMAMEKPIVSTSIGAEGLPVRDGKEILLADTPEAFAKAVINLFQNKEAADELGKRAAKLVREEFGWQKVAQRFAEICEGVIKITPARTSIEPGRSSVSRTQVRVEQVQEI